MHHRRYGFGWIALAALFMSAAPLAAQEEHAAEEQQDSHEADEGHGSSNEIDIMHHLANTRVIEYPCLKRGLVCELELPRFAPIQVGSIAFDFSPTKHSMYILLAAVLILLVCITSAVSVTRAHSRGEPATGFASAIEATALYVRREVILPNVGAHGEGFVPYLLTLFFFILTLNLLGLLPYGSTATGNIAVTAALALLAFLVIEFTGMRALGFSGYMQTIFYVPHGLPGLMKPVMLVIMTPVEIIGKLAKPFALAVRLFANMTAGHVVVLALIGLTFFFQSYFVGTLSALLATGIMLLELFVAFLQAYVFTLLTSVFIGLMRTAH